MWHCGSANKPLWICLFPSYTHTTVFAYQDAGRWMHAIRPFRQEEMMELPGGHTKLALLAQLQRRWVEEQKLGGLFAQVLLILFRNKMFSMQEIGY